MSVRRLRPDVLLPLLLVVLLAALLALVPSRTQDGAALVPAGVGHGSKPTAESPTRSLFDLPPPPVPSDRPDPNVPRSVADLRSFGEDESRCAEGERRVFVLLHGDDLALVSHVDEVVTGPGSIELPLVLDTTSRALPLAALTAERPQATTVEIWPCRGAPLRVPVAEIEAAPGRWLLVRTPRVFLKLVDRRVHDKRPQVRNVAAVRLVP